MPFGGYPLLIAAGSLQGLLLGLALLSQSQKAPWLHRFLAVLLLAATVDITVSLFHYAGQLASLPHLLRLNTPMTLLYGPLLFGLARAATCQAFQPKAWHGLHLLPFVACLLYFLPLYVQSASFKVAYLASMQDMLPVESYVWGGARRVLLGGYLTAVSWMLWQNRGQRTATWRLAGGMTAGFAFVWGLDVYDYAFDFRLLTSADHLQFTLFAILLFGATFVLLRRTISHFFFAAPIPKYAQSGIEVKTAEKLLVRLREQMEVQASYLNPSFKLKDLAAATNLTPHIVSQVLNTVGGQNFAGFVNHYRIEAAMQELLDASQAKRTVAEIAFSCGFNSLSAFNAAFKKQVGMTPTAFRKAPKS